MDVQLYNFSQEIVDRIKEVTSNVKSDTIILGADAIDEDLLDILKEDEITVIYMDSKTFNDGILSILSGEPNVLCVIDTANATEEEECLFDDCIINFSDSVDIIIINTKEDSMSMIIDNITGYIGNIRIYENRKIDI